jgi:CheY-like chemotaxis protein
VVASGMLRLLGCTTGLANNGLEAIAQWHDGHWDLILMDCSMPGMDGYEATITIRGLESGTSRRTPIIAMTAKAFVEDRQKSFAAGMNEHLAKPLEAKEIIKTLVKFVVQD